MSSCPFESCLPPLRLDLVQTFLVVAHEGNVSRAARRLFLTHQRAARRVRALERQLGVRLLAAAGSAVQLTQEGRELLPHAEALVAAARLLVAPGERVSGSRRAWR